ncbi:MAG: hypothetical protein VXZ96_11615 [Myxococcota bacterium]|nr:hypothetical protein [Myxococcota bacterium]
MNTTPNQIDKKGLLIAALLSLVIGCFLCWDAVSSGGRRVVGASGAEIWAFVWGHFWFAQSIIEQGTWPQFTLLSDFPDGGALWLKDPIMLVLMLPVQLIFGVPSAVTASQLLLFVLSASGGFLLCKQLGLSRSSSVISGLIYAFCPHTLGEAFNGNIEALNTCWLPLWLWSWLKVMTHFTWKNTLISGVALFLLLIGNQYWGLAMAFAAPAVFAVCLLEDRTNWKRLFAAASLSVLVGLVLFAPVGWWIWESLQHSNRLNDITSGSISLSVPYVSDLKHLYDPMAKLWKLEVLPPPFQDLIYPGVILVIGSLVAPLGQRSKWGILCLVLGLSFTVLALGPALSFDGEVLQSERGNMYALPWWYLITNQPALNWMTLPHRMIIPATLFFSIAFAITVDRFLAKKWHWGLGALVLTEFFVYPSYQIPLVTTGLPKTDHALFLRHIPQKGALLNIPVNLTSNHMRIYFWYQVIHQRPIAMSLRYSEYPSISKEVPFVEISSKLTQAILPSTEEPDPLNIEGLREAGFGFILVHSRYLREFLATEPEIYLPYANAHLGKGIVFSDESVLYPLRQEEFTSLMRIAAESLGEPWIKGNSIDIYGLPQGASP